jgi:N-acetylglucosamine kinase-like BadF-type ATPase
MKKSFLIADSGGTKTDWCFVDFEGEKVFFTTESYHPNLMTEDWIKLNKPFWEKYITLENLEVHFYGSGCLKEPNKSKVKNVFEIWGFKQITVESDILAAARACFGNNNAWIGILGTGSVLAEIENQEVKNVFGGLGFLLGDEGSGFYFGKLLIEKYKNNGFSNETTNELNSTIGKENLINLNVTELESKDFISRISRSFSKSINQEIQKLHQENIELFFEKYLPKTYKDLTIYFVGSYAQYNKEFIKENLLKRQLNFGGIITKPIQSLTEYTLKSTL